MPRWFRLSITATVLLVTACPPGSKPDDTAGTDDTDTHETDTPVGDGEAEQVLYLEDGPGDLDVMSDGRILVVTRYGGHVLSWTPGVDGTDTLQRSIAGLEGIFVGSDDTLWAAVSDGGIVGSVGWLESHDMVAVADQADDGTLFRYPRDVVMAPDGMLLMADATVGALFRTEPATGSTTAYYVEIASPRRLLFVGETLYVGGSDGIYTVDYPGSTATLVDGREAWGLLEQGGRVLASNADAKVFEVGGDSLGGAEIDWPGGMLAVDSTLYVSDLGGRYLYAMTLD
jgi:hypothetical protein